MKKTAMKVMALAMASLMAMSMSAFAGETEKEVSYDFAGGTVYGIYKAGDQTWFIDEGNAAKAKVEADGGEFIYVDAKMSPEEYLKDIDNAIANNAAGIVTCIPDQTLSQATVDKCKEAGIPVVAGDDALEVDGEKIAPWVGIDAYNIGAANGEWIANYAIDNGTDCLRRKILVS